MSSLFLSLTAAFLTLQTPEVASGLELSVSSVPFGPAVDEISLRVRGGEILASQTLYLRQTSERPLTDVRLFVLVEGKPALVIFGGESDDVWSVPPHGAETEIKLTWTDVIPSGSVEGVFIATLAGSHFPIAKVKVTKDAEPPLHLLEATDDGIKLTSTTTTFQHVFHIVSDVDHDVGNVQIAVEPLVDSSSQQVVPRIEVDGSAYDGSRALRIPGRTTKPFVLRADLTRAGIHRGVLALRWAGGEQSVAIELTRTQVPASLEVADIANVRLTLGGNDGSSANLRVALRETEGRIVDLSKLTLLALLHKVGTDEVQVGNATLEVGFADKPLGPRESRTILLTVGGLRMPGEYTSTFRFSAGDAPPIDKSAKIFVRRNAWIAMLLIAAGTVASGVLRWFLTTRKSQLASQRQAIELGEDLERIAGPFGPLPQREARLVQHLRDRVARLYRDTTTDAKSSVRTALDEFGRKLPILAGWLRMRASFGGSPSPGEVRAKLLEVEQFLWRRDTMADEAIAQSTALQDLEKTIAGLPSVQDAIESLSKAVEERAGASKSPTELIGVRAPLDEATTAAKKGQLEEAAAKLREAQEAWRKLLCQDLEQILGRVEPPGIDPANWQRLAHEARSHLAAAQTASDHDEAIHQYQMGLGITLDGMTQALQEAVSKLIQGCPPGERLSRLTAEVASMQDDLREGLDATSLAATQRRYDEAVKVFVQIGNDSPESRRFIASMPHYLPLRAPSMLADEVFVVEPIDITASALPPRWKINLQIYAGDLSITGVLLAIAVFMGLQLLYYPNAIWGSAMDCVTALLWGLGLHEVGNTSFQGLRGLRTTFAAPPR